jgi:16S rRNA processing protein RimM
MFFGDSPDDLDTFPRFFLGREKKPAEIERWRAVKNVVVLKLAGVDSVEDAQKLIGQTLFICREDVTLPEGRWFVEDLLGMAVFDADDNHRYGAISDVLQNAPTDVYVIKTPEGRELLFPAITDVLIETNVTERYMKIRPLPGLFET